MSSFVEPCLIWLLIGSLVWMTMDGVGIVSDTYALWLREGRAPSAGVMVVATIYAIVVWPYFVWKFFEGLVIGIAETVRRSRR